MPNLVEINNQRYLIKSRFLLGAECLTKLFYTGKDEYSERVMGFRRNAAGRVLRRRVRRRGRRGG